MTGLIVDLFAGGGGASTGIAPEVRQRFASLVRWAPGDQCWEWQGYRSRRKNGALTYGTFCIGKRRFLAHRMAWLLAHGEDPGDSVVRHRCDNVACVRPDHLLLGTQADNLQDMRERGRAYFNCFAPGQSHPNAKLTPERVREVRALKASGLSCAKVGARFGINAATVHAIVTRKTWGHVP